MSQTWNKLATYLSITKPRKVRYNASVSKAIRRLEKKNLLDHKNKEGRTLLMLCVLYNHTKTFKELLQKGASVYVMDNKGIDVILHSVLLSDASFFNRLIRFKQLKKVRYSSGRNLAEILISMEVVRLDFYLKLVQNDWPIKFRFDDGSTHLHKLCALPLEKFSSLDPFYENITVGELKEIQLACAKVLLERGSKVDARNHEGVTPLHLCCLYNRHELLKALFNPAYVAYNTLHENFDNIANIRDNENLTPIYYCCHEKNQHFGTECAEQLVSKGANIYYRIQTERDEKLTLWEYAFSGKSISEQQQHFLRWLLPFFESTINKKELLKLVIKHDAHLVLEKLVADSTTKVSDEMISKLMTEFARNSNDGNCIDMLMTRPTRIRVQLYTTALSRHLNHISSIFLIKKLVEEDKGALFDCAEKQNSRIFRAILAITCLKKEKIIDSILYPFLPGNSNKRSHQSFRVIESELFTSAKCLKCTNILKKGQKVKRKCSDITRSALICSICAFSKVKRRSEAYSLPIQNLSKVKQSIQMTNCLNYSLKKSNYFPQMTIADQEILRNLGIHKSWQLKKMLKLRLNKKVGLCI